MTRRFLLSLVLLLCGLVAARAAQDLYNPLAVDMRWEVDVDMLGLTGEKTHGTAIREITGTQKIGPYYYFVVTTRFTDLPTMKDFTMYRRKSPKGVYAISSLDRDKQEHLETALPLSVGLSWKTVVFGQVITSKVEAKEAIKVGETAYADCLKISYRSSDGKMAGTFWQAPDVGNVQEETNVNGSVFKFTLKKFSGLK